MIAPEPTADGGTAGPGPASRNAPSTAPPDGAPVSTLRGAGVSVDSRVAGRVAILLGFVTVVIVAIVLAVAGNQKNAQITSLRTHGVSVQATVTGCTGLLGGSGSNGAGDACAVSYSYAGHQYHEDLPGSGLVASGTNVQGIVASNDPALFTTPSALATQHPSARVYIVPAILLAVLVLLGATLVVRRRRSPA